ncbi:MutT/nudix family protein [Rhodovulum sp. PH10]|uniref:NUDIX hydrolase n=1 Tax=Rhodovulum sp. PH10 TaxID=1187851 RepID=UPI00027C2C24|nr:MutT/nudix family protein [Rhodovulum sp. PH10]EJW12065.1 MutT/nudix family protein [Rhodovulum sp. PH10]
MAGDADTVLYDEPAITLSLVGDAPMALAERLTEHLNEFDRVMTWPNVVPKDAATLILIDRTGPAPKVLLGRRHANLKFMAGKFVFPGGRVEVADRGIPAASELDPAIAARLMLATARPSPAKARAFAIAAVRETFEETGLMLGRPGGARPPAAAALEIAAPASPSPAADAASPAPASPAAVAAWPAFAAAGVSPDLASLQFIARAVTPPRRPRRFDARFFAVDAQAIAGRVDGIVGPDSELVELVWMTLKDAESLDLPPITKAVVAELDHRIAQGFAPELPIPFYRWVRGRFVRALL